MLFSLGVFLMHYTEPAALMVFCFHSFWHFPERDQLLNSYTKIISLHTHVTCTSLKDSVHKAL